MKLVAIWIEKYMGLENLGFNLGDELFFDFVFNDKERKLTIRAEKTNDYFNLFENSKIKNISGLIGNNGAGKTSFLKLLNVCESKSPIEHCVFILLKDENTQKFIGFNYGNVFKKNKIEIILTDELKDIISPYSITTENSDNPFKDFDLLFYSNLYSAQNDGYLKNRSNLNRSVDYLTRKTLSQSNIEKYNKRYNKLPKQSEAQYNVLNLYFIERFKKLIHFLSVINTQHPELKKIIDFIPFPNTLNINFNEDLYEQFNSKLGGLDSENKILERIIQYATNYFNKEKNIELRFVRELAFKFFLITIQDEFATIPRKKLLLKNLDLFLKNGEIDIYIFDLLNNFLMSYERKDWKEKTKKLNNFLGQIFNKKLKIVIKENRLLPPFGLNTYKIDVTDSVWNFIKGINDLFEDDEEPLITFRWHGLSSGQEAILNQFVQLWEGINNVRRSYLIITIDEGELYLHPEWQRRYIDLIYTFVNYFIERNEHIINSQIILSSHSPFIVSDIPKFNLVFMDRKEDSNILGEKVMIKSSQLQQATFGGNIFELYKNSFFVKDFFGEYSIKWLNEAFNKVSGKPVQTNPKDFNLENDEHLKKFIQIIGEKVLKDVIQSQLTNLNQSDEYEIVNLTEDAKKKLKVLNDKTKSATIKKQSKKRK